jgi:spore maturation protein CgeB
VNIIVLGLSITSSWGNGHATTYRALLRALNALGHRILFLERNVPWYDQNRDELAPEGCLVALYDDLDALKSRFDGQVRQADAVIVGSFVPDGAEVLCWVLETTRGLRLFYDIDTPVTVSKLLRGEKTYIERQSIKKLDAYLSFAGGPVLELIERELGAELCLPLYCSVDASLYTPLPLQPTRDLGYLGTYSADRQPALTELLIEPARRSPEHAFVVAGPSYPQDIAWPENVERVHHVGPKDHARFYGSLRYALNLTRADMIGAGYSPSVRLFEAAACGVPIVSDRWVGIDEFFEPGRELLLCSSAEQMLEYLNDLPETERLKIGQRARARVLSQHSSVHRALELDRYLRALRSDRTRLLDKSVA